MTSSQNIPLGTEAKERMEPPGTPLPPAQTSGLGKWHEWIFVFNVCLAQIFSLAGLAQSFAPLLIIAEGLGVDDPGQMSWYTAAYSMTLGTFILPAGRLGDMYGHKKMFIVGWIWFSLASLITGFSYVGGPIMLATCRGLQGIGPALLVPNGIALIARTFPIGMKRAISIAAFGGCGPVGVTLGVVFSSIFAQLLWWPWMFWTSSIAAALCCIFSAIVLPPDTYRSSPADPANKTKEQFDLLGAFTGVTGLLLINFALNEAPVEGWNHVYIPVLLGVGFLLMAAFVWVELCVASRPIVPLKGLHRDAAFTLACIAAGWASHGIWCYYLFLFIEKVRGHQPLVAAAETWPVALVGFSAALAVPFILRKMKVPYLMSISMLFFFAGTILLVFAPVAQTYWINTFLSVIIMPFAMNWSFPSGTILMANAVSKQHQGIAASLICTMVNYSIATGLGIAGTLDRYLSPIHGLHGGYRDAWWFGIALSLFGFLISLYFIWQTRSRKPMIAK
ncbi:hypothetical protein M409DRAFT_67994 [Zasmidium cellare ATCC 36951]|uniref:Major facilitator superfamily (MFS) profile domain-containing protein n=1 Tax=Zasmidium cellare ATCC 36951 TaxID=1080233 RepID=A0A6A6CBI1_ZASCE|nr:uncharacterized protein M409DRAFT_67994 [Zasmidium cellare ATCC 36951]KAF2164514.1 hypothetical protein M409DRAFT_67994 [Zasmidium cellare ATCC 36951]